MMTNKRKSDKCLIGRKSTASLNHEVANEWLTKGINAFEVTEHPGFPLDGNNACEIEEEQKEEKLGNAGASYGQEPADFEHGPSRNLLSIYMREVAKIPLLGNEEERALAKEIQEGHRDLVYRLRTLNLELREMDNLVRKQRNITDELIAAIIGRLEKLEGENEIASYKIDRIDDIRSLYARLGELKGEMLKRNLRLVIKIAKEHMYSGISLSDLVQEGNLGLMRAVTKFDYRRGYRFSTYATWWIRQAILRAIVEKERVIRIPVHLMEKRRKLARTCSNFLKERGKIPQPEEIAKKARLPLKVVRKALFSFPETVSLETSVGGDSTLGYFIEDEKSPSPFEMIERKELRQLAEKVLSHLPPREAEILRLRFGMGGDEEHTLQQIGRRFGISRERVRQLEKKGINRLRYRKKELSGHVDKNGFEKGIRPPVVRRILGKS